MKIGSGSGIRDPRLEVMRVEIVRTDRGTASRNISLQFMELDSAKFALFSAITPNLPTNITPTKIAGVKLSGNSPMGLGIPPLIINIMLESNPLKSIMLVGRLAVLYPVGWCCHIIITTTITIIIIIVIIIIIIDIIIIIIIIISAATVTAPSPGGQRGWPPRPPRQPGDVH